MLTQDPSHRKKKHRQLTKFERGTPVATVDQDPRNWIQDEREDVSMGSLSSKVFDQAPTEDEVRLMEGMMAEWHAADLADVGVYEDDLYSKRIQDMAKTRPSLLNEDGDEGHWRILGGHQGLAEKMSKELDVRLSTVVQSISWHSKVHVRHTSGSLTAKCAVITVPLACVSDIAFEPPLPEDKQMAVKELGRGVTTTVSRSESFQT